MEYLINVLGDVLDFINGLAINISEKFTGESSNVALVMVIFYLIALIIILWLLKGVVSIIKDLFRTVFYRSKKKIARVMPPDNAATNSDNKGVDHKIRTKNDDDLSLIKGFGNKKYIDDLSRTLKKINELDNYAVQSQHISNKIPLTLIIGEDNIVLSEKEKLKITKQVEGKNLNELKDLLEQANNEEVKLDDVAKSLSRDLSKTIKEREKLVQQEVSAIEQYNNTVDALATLCDELTKSKSDLSEKHSELLGFITNLGEKKAVLLDNIREFKKEISSLPGKIKTFASLCDKESDAIMGSFQQKEELLAGFKKNYTAISESRNKKDKDISAIQQEQSKAAVDKAFNIELASMINVKINELEELEKERLAKEEAERIERERLAKEEAERLERERLAKEEAERLERERLAKEEAERLERERLAKEEAERLERERQEKLEAEKLEKERLAKEEAERLEKERLAREEAERLERERQEKLRAEKLEKERLAKEEAERLEQERLAKEEAERAEKERLAKLEAEKVAGETPNSSDVELNEIKEQIKRHQQVAYSMNFDDITPEMLEKLAIAEQKKRRAAEKAAKLNGKTPMEPERNDNDINGTSTESIETKIKATTPNAVISEEETVPQTDYISELKQQWAEEEAHKQRWAEEKARREAENQRRKQELIEKLSGNGFSDDSE